MQHTSIDLAESSKARAMCTVLPLQGGMMLLHGKSPSAVGIPCWRAQVDGQESVVGTACVLVHVCYLGRGVLQQQVPVAV
jgi:hypothetical protein